jgi:peroxisomal membrane protein 4
MQEEQHPTVCPHSSCVLSCLKGFATGVTFAVKVRFTHALVIAILFRSGSLIDKLKYIVQLSFEHSSRLGCYVAGFKALQCLFARLAGKRRPGHAFVAGLLAGFVFFGTKTLVTTQMTLYLLGRVVAGCVKLALRPLQLPRSVSALLFPLTSVLCWGFVMLLFRLNPQVLQPSLASSMRLLYVQSDTWKSKFDFIPFGTTLATYLKP